MGRARSLHSAGRLLLRLAGSRGWGAALVVAFRGFRRFGGRMGREVDGLFGGVPRRRA